MPRHTFSSPDPMADHCRPMPPPETPGHSQGRLAQSPVGSLLLSPGSWCAQGFLVPSKSLFPPYFGSFVVKSHWPSKSNSLMVLSPVARSLGWEICGGANGNFLQEGLCHNQVCCTQSPCPLAGHCWFILPQETLIHSSGSASAGSRSPGVHRVCLSPLSVSGGYRVWF